MDTANGKGDDSEQVAVAGLQRARILAAVVAVCAERGAAQVTIADVIARAGVSRRTFYDFFASCEDCLLAALEHALERVRTRVLAAAGGQRRWRGQMCAGLTELLELMEAEPRPARLLVVDSLALGRAALGFRTELLGELHAVLDAGRGEAKSSAGLSPLTAQATVGGVLAVLYDRLVDDPRPALGELLGPLMAVIVLPYLGPAAACAELERPPAARPPWDRDREQAGEDERLTALNMRVTYRTMRVLQAIGERPGASNKEIGAAAGAHDQGQVSKLLARLQRLELIVNERDRARGATNAWRLTARGRAVRELSSASLGAIPSEIY